MMLARRTILNAIGRAGHVCLRSSCKHCLAVSSLALRTFATKPARQDQNREYDISRISNKIHSELESQNKLIEEESLSIERVNEDYAKIINDNNIKIEDINAEEVRMTITKDNGLQYILKFDPSIVANAINAGIAEEAMEDEDMEEEFNEEDQYEGDIAPFDVSIEVRRPGVSKTLIFHTEATPSFEGSGYDVNLVDLTVEKDGTVYSGPSFDTLDDGLREQFDQFVNKNFRKLVPLVADYAKVKEAKLYQEWLTDVKEVVTGQN